MPSPRHVPDQESLERSYQKALSCFDRALFYVTSERSVLVQKKMATHQGEWSEATVLEYCSVISKLYTDTGNTLILRYGLIVTKYATLYNKMVAEGMQLVDRHPKAVALSADIAGKKLAELLDESLDSVEFGSGHEEAIWNRTEHHCQLLMEEIVYLSDRVNELDNLWISEDSLRSTKVSVVWAVWGIAISAAFSFLSYCPSSIFNKKSKMEIMQSTLQTKLETTKQKIEAAREASSKK